MHSPLSEEPYLCLLRRKFCAAGGILLWLQRCNFRTAEQLFLLTTAAQNMRDPHRKFLSLGNHFFERLKTADSSTACGTSTLKSLPSWAFFVSDVHLRPRKHFSRCTLDCGFKTSESPALRGFEAGPRALATAALYLVIFSNGLRHSKNLPVKFGFRPEPFPRISPKSYRHNAVPNRISSHFSASRTNGPRSLSRVKVGTHSPLLKGSHTAAYTAKHGPSLPRPQRGLVLPAISLLFHHAFIYIHFPVLCEPPLSAEEKNPAKLLP